LLKAKALEAAAVHFADAGDGGQARDAFTRAVQVYTSLGAVADVARLQADSASLPRPSTYSRQPES
jgi:hypothetical protein